MCATTQRKIEKKYTQSFRPPNFLEKWFNGASLAESSLPNVIFLKVFLMIFLGSGF